jgi:hypothetical protein
VYALREHYNCLTIHKHLRKIGNNSLFGSGDWAREYFQASKFLKIEHHNHHHNTLIQFLKKSFFNINVIHGISRWRML